MKKIVCCLFLSFFLVGYVFASGGKLSLKLNLGGTYLMGGDYNKGIKGYRDYQLSDLEADETFVDEMKMLGPGFQLAAELLYNLSPSLAVGLEAGYLSAEVTSHYERTWRSYDWTINPTLSAIPVTLNVNYYKPLAKKIKLHAMAGAGAFFTSLVYNYDIYNTVNPYSGTWSPESKIAFGAKAGIGLEYELSSRFILTVDLTGRFAEVKGFTGAYEGMYTSGPKTGTVTLYFYHYDAKYPMIGLFESAPSTSHVQDAREAKWSLSGASLLIGGRINL